ncbi:MAG TPA: hypothetical protein ENJ59_00910 [Thermofilum sp.]|nr:hypothetical protein [Thermofilum sp.]
MAMKLLRENAHIPVATVTGIILGLIKVDLRIGISIILVLIYPLFKFFYEGKSWRWLIEYFGLSVTAWSIAASFVTH